MQSSTSSVAMPEAILEWLQKEMGYRPLGPYASSSTKAAAFAPTADSIRNMCRGNMIPVWHFLLKRVKSEKTVDNIRRNILVHGGSGGVESDAAVAAGDVGRSNNISRGITASTSATTAGTRRRKEKIGAAVGKENSVSGLVEKESSRDIALQERELAEKEVERLRQIVRRQRKELKARMLEVSREEAERKRMLDERSNYRFVPFCLHFPLIREELFVSG